MGLKITVSQSLPSISSFRYSQQPKLRMPMRSSAWGPSCEVSLKRGVLSVTVLTAFLTVYLAIFFRVFALSLIASVVMRPFMVPFSRRIFVRCRVSIP